MPLSCAKFCHCLLPSTDSCLSLLVTVMLGYLVVGRFCESALAVELVEIES